MLDKRIDMRNHLKEFQHNEGGWMELDAVNRKIDNLEWDLWGSAVSLCDWLSRAIKHNISLIHINLMISSDY
jgi:hypothetical protein